MAAKYLAVFDLDGTLNRTDLFSIPAHQQAQKEFGSPPDVRSREYILSTYGMRAEDYMALFLPGSDEETVRRYIRRVAELENETMGALGRPYDGVPEVLDELRRRGIETAVCSNASVRYITAVLEAIGLRERINHIQHLVKGLSKNETLALLLDRVKPDRAVMIGDRVFDIDAARACGIPSIGCLYGFNPAEAAQADETVAHASELAGSILKLFEFETTER